MTKPLIDRSRDGRSPAVSAITGAGVQRNIDRFPGDFMFRLNATEFANWKSQIVTSNPGAAMGLRKQPYAWPQNREAQADLRTEVVQVDRETLDTELTDESIEEPRISVEAVFKLRWGVAIATSRKVLRNDPPAVGQCRYEIAKLI